MIKGQAYYVSDVTVSDELKIVTKETPDNYKTKASFKVKGRLKIQTHSDGTKEAIIH